jgi:hypothetical protein
LRQEAAVHRTLLAAAIYPDNTPHGYNLTFAFFEIMFVVVAAALYLRFRSRHLALLAGRRPYRPAAGTATAVAEAGPATGRTTHGSTLQEGEAPESPAQEATTQETTEESE